MLVMDARSADVWAFGVLLWEMFSGQRAWAGMSYTQVMQAVGYEQRGPEWPPSAPPPLAVSPHSDTHVECCMPAMSACHHPAVVLRRLYA